MPTSSNDFSGRASLGASPSTPNRSRSATPALAEGFVLLDNSTSLEAVSELFEHPVEIVRADTPAEVDAAVASLTAGLARGLHAAGFFSYELGYLLEPRLASLLPANRKVPLLWFGLYSSPRGLRGSEVQAWLNDEAIGTPTLGELAHSWDSGSYLKRFAEVQNNIRSGDIYQLNLTFKAKFKLAGSPLALYRDLRLKQRVLYAGLVDTGDVTILSASPELFIKQSGTEIETRPMKGTAPRAGTQEADAEVRRALSKDIKNRAENLMIVDLMRNDLGRIAELGSVSVTDLFTVETFKTLHQMTSGVRADLKSGIGLADILKAIFPPGSVTGAPKIRAMELIRELETEARGIYCGAIGRFSPDGRGLFNVAIRTAVIDRKGAGEMGIGSGIVADSDGVKEYAECLLKMKFLTDPVRRFDLIETMLHEPGAGIWLRGYHLARLAASATYFGFVFDAERVNDAIDRAVAENPNERLRVRLLLDEDGGLTVTATPQPATPPDSVMRYVISDSRVNSTDLFLYHKSTRRDLYDREWKHFSETLGADEVIYLNENGELTEGSRTTIFLERDGKLLTPRLAAGVLPGTLRAALLDDGKAVEAKLTVQDLNGPGNIYLGNSVRGLMRAEPLVPRLAVDDRNEV
ncbi:aminodeoxychorismate synthase component I [Hyphomicrobium methylovorum]|uniref:aminodeoxychorismate synthase component I n=1 Tax=Hyphomicrobium methylovorum TaxID=84 RepID=UPI0015E7A3BA|nr:aminodeoxychorismate synthase component I [Hyphomicrobium methylovorum]MBA2125856.1 aminodeoxychorismate synthase component I [Hyphomicrobium methylovorum]